MLRSLLLLLLFATPQPGKKQPAKTANPGDAPAYTADGDLKFPEKYREWVFLTSGIDMSYSATGEATRSVFDNVFVNPSAYRSFLETGIWPDKTVLVLENRGAEGSVSINTRGHTQSAKVTGLEVHVKDKERDGVWTFYGFENEVSGKPFPRAASCYSCHEQHAAVDTTFVQFYPTLLEKAKNKGTLSAEYLKKLSAPAESR